MLTIEEIKERVTPICEKYKIDRMWLFGSYARGEADEKSVEEVLKMPFDLVEREGLSKRFLRFMKEDEVLIYERK